MFFVFLGGSSDVRANGTNGPYLGLQYYKEWTMDRGKRGGGISIFVYRFAAGMCTMRQAPHTFHLIHGVTEHGICAYACNEPQLK